MATDRIYNVGTVRQEGQFLVQLDNYSHVISGYLIFTFIAVVAGVMAVALHNNRYRVTKL